MDGMVREKDWGSGAELFREEGVAKGRGEGLGGKCGGRVEG